jgi:hypothetical protein
MTADKGCYMEIWPALPYDEWKDTCDTLHLWTQMVGKVKLELCPFLNQWWEVALHLSARGIVSGPIPWRDTTFDAEFDLIADQLVIRSSEGPAAVVRLESVSTATFYERFRDALGSLGIEVQINTMPSEIPNAVPFDRDTVHDRYDGADARRWWRILLGTERIMNRFRVPFHGKSSPINLFWGGFDLNHTRFNGDPAEARANADRMVQYGENESNFAVGFWPGGPGADAAFYAYMTPTPDGIEQARIEPAAAHYVAAMGEFLLPYAEVRQASNPERAILDFFQSAYAASADLAGWDRTQLEGNVPRLNQTG